MSTTIDQRVVEMQFDNRQFERNVSTTMSTLDKLKQSLNLSGASKGLESVGTAARGINLQPLGSAVETVGLKFNAMWTIADQALRNITNSAYRAGERIVKSLTIDPIKMGFSEYETQINAVQTILANTESKGTTLADVNGALDTLNTYADKTIYNFTEMTRNIGTFTAAGVDLDTSVNAIQGIANLAAVSGSNSQQASTAMYQLSQALASGTVKLMDWNSVVNAGMGGQVFQDALKETARVHGVAIDDMIKKNGSFRETLQEGWLTADILTETLSHFTMAAEQGSEQWNEYKKSLMDSGYSEEQANAILKLSNTATDAATKVKTATQLFDTLKETAQSGWTQTWEILFGDFEEAKSLFSELYETIAPLLERSAKVRNELLEGWAQAGGRNDLLESMRNIFEGIGNVVKPIKEAFQDIFPQVTVDQLIKFTRGFRELTEKFVFWKQALLPVKGQMEEFGRTEAEIIEHNAKLKKNIDNIVRVFKGLFAIVDIAVDAIVAFGKGVFELLGMTIPAGEGLLSMLAAIGDWAVGLRDASKETDIFGTAIEKVVGFIGKIVNELKKFGSAALTSLDTSKLDGFLGFFQGLWEVVKKIGSKIGDIFTPLVEGIKNIFTSSTFMDVLDSGLLAGLIAAVVGFGDKLTAPLQGITDIFEGIAGEGGVLSGVKDILDGVKGSLEAYQNSLKADILQKIAIAIGILAASIFVISSIDAAALDHSLGAIGVMFGELMGSLYVFSKMAPELNGVTKAVGLMIGLSVGILILSGAMKSIASLDWGGIAKGLVVMSVAIGALVAALNLMPRNWSGSFEGFDMKTTTKLMSAGIAFIAIAASMKIFASAMKDFSQLNWEDIGKGLVAIGGLLAGVIIAMNKLPSNWTGFAQVFNDKGNKSLVSAGIAFIAIAASMKIFASAMKDFAQLEWEEIGKGLAAMAGSLVAVSLAMKLVPTNAFSTGVGIIAVAAAMKVLASALSDFGGMSWAEIGRGLVAMGVALAELAIGLTFMSGTQSGSASLLVAVGALLLLVPVLKSLGDMSWGEIIKGLVTIAGAFAILGAAAFILMPIVPTMLALSGAIALFGAAILGIGAGLTLIGIGITSIATALATGATAIVAGLAGIIAGIVELIPTIVLGLGDAILAICTVIKECAPAIVDTLFVLISEVCASFATYVPIIGNALFDLLIGAINVLAERMPELIVAVVNLLGSFFQGIVDALSGIDTSGLLKGIAGVGILTALIFALSALTPMIPGAMVGILGMGVLIAELALVLAAVGALAQIPGLSWLIGEGGDLLQQIGTAIGQFIGGIVGGIAEGATSTLPQVGTNLSDFATNLQPFIDGMSGIDSTILDNTTTLAKAILALTAADLISGIASFFKGGTSLADFGTEIVSFGTAMKNYAAEVAGLDTASISASVTAAKDLVKIAGEIPSDGAFGTDGIDDFGRNIVTFGKKMKQYAAEVVGIDAVSIAASVSAAKGLVQVAKQIPDDGAFGTDGIDNFGKNVVTFGKKLKKYSEEVADVSSSAVTKSVSIVRSLVSAINSLTGLDTSGISSFKKAINELSKVNIDGVVKAFDGASSRLSNIGSKMVESISMGLKSKGSTLSTTGSNLVNMLTKSITSNAHEFTKAGTEFATNLAKGITSQNSKMKSSMTTTISSVIGHIRSYYSSFHSAGSYLVTGFANGISANSYRAAAKARAMAASAARAARNELDINSPSRVGYEIGDFFGLGFVNAIGDYTKTAYKASSEMAGSAKNGLRNSISNISDAFGDGTGSPVIRPVLDLSDIRAGAGAISSLFGTESVGLSAIGSINTAMNRRSQNGGADEIVSAINKLQKALDNTGNTTNIINGVTYDDGSAINDAVGVIARAILMEGRT